LREGVVIQVSYRGGECKKKSREESVYFNVKREECVIQASLKGGECNLLLFYQ